MKTLMNAMNELFDGNCAREVAPAEPMTPYEVKMAKSLAYVPDLLDFLSSHRGEVFTLDELADELSSGSFLSPIDAEGVHLALRALKEHRPSLPITTLGVLVTAD